MITGKDRLNCVRGLDMISSKKKYIYIYIKKILMNLILLLRFVKDVLLRCVGEEV